jgi:hypothetical protein
LRHRRLERIRATKGTPICSANAAPPPSPNTACREPSGATNSLMFSTTPTTFMYERRAMSATLAATFCAAPAGVVTTSISACGSIRERPICTSPVPGGMSMSR